MAESTFAALAAALSQIADPGIAIAVLAAVPLGVLIGVLPGLNGIIALALLIPYTFGMHPLAAMSFLLAAYAAVSQGGAVTAIVLGIPGEVPNAATTIDGQPLARSGRAGEAIGAVATASAVGGLFAGLLLLALLPLLQPLVLAFASPELFFLSLAGLAFVAVLDAEAPIKGLIAGLLGLFLSLVGYAPTDGMPRFWFGIDYLLDGIRLAPLALGLFAIPEIISLLGKHGGTATVMPAAASLRQVLHGARAALRYPGHMLRSSGLGSLIGMMPGVGASTATFVAYAVARKNSTDPESFGQGRLEGVIAPEAASNAKEGGALLPTLALGIPGSASMSLLLAALILHGVQPGPEFLDHHLDTAIALGLVLTLGNVAASIFILFLAAPLVRIGQLPSHLLGPVLLLLVLTGSFAVANDPGDLVALLICGGLGLAMARLGYSRPALLLGFVLGEGIERYFHISIQAYGPQFWQRPIGLVILALTLFILLRPPRRINLS